MSRSWTFGQKVGAGFASAVLLTILIAGVGIYALRTVVQAKDRVLTVNAQNLTDAQRLNGAIELKVAALRGYLLDRDERSLQEAKSARSDFRETLDRMKAQALSGESRRLIDQIERAEADHQAAFDRVVALRRTSAALDAVNRLRERATIPTREVLTQQLNAFVSREEQLLEAAKQGATQTASSATGLMVVITIVAVLVATVLALLLTRALSRQISSAVQHIQSASTELQSAANQQASGSKEQATAMSEIAVTVQELLATARQIAESAQRVAKIAEDTVSSAHLGDQTVQMAQEGVSGIRRQVDLIVTHMLDLGKKSQQIGGILELINELAEQTNILAINATIEAAGAGEMGKRFAAVADEIRKLADRVGSSTKEIRTLIEEVRAAVHTTVMVTESGSKAVEAGTQQFGDVAVALKQIVGLVGTTTEAAREIELSTKQQSSAVEQVNVATANAAQGAKESEVSALQTVQTATDLATLSRELAQLVQPGTRERVAAKA